MVQSPELPERDCNEGLNCKQRTVWCCVRPPAGSTSLVCSLEKCRRSMEHHSLQPHSRLPKCLSQNEPQPCACRTWFPWAPEERTGLWAGGCGLVAGGWWLTIWWVQTAVWPQLTPKRTFVHAPRHSQHALRSTRYSATHTEIWKHSAIWNMKLLLQWDVLQYKSQHATHTWTILPACADTRFDAATEKSALSDAQMSP